MKRLVKYYEKEQVSVCVYIYIDLCILVCVCLYIYIVQDRLHLCYHGYINAAQLPNICLNFTRQCLQHCRHASVHGLHMCTWTSTHIDPNFDLYVYIRVNVNICTHTRNFWTYLHVDSVDLSHPSETRCPCLWHPPVWQFVNACFCLPNHYVTNCTHKFGKTHKHEFICMCSHEPADTHILSLSIYLSIYLPS